MDPDKVFTNPQVAELARAAAAGDAARVRSLVSAGANPDAHGDKHVTPLEWALLHDSREGFDALLDAGADPEEPAVGDDPVILMAAKARDPEFLRILLAHHVDPSRPRGRRQITPLMAAAGPTTEAQFKLLLNAGADPGQTDRMGNTALHVAAETGAYAQVLALLEAGADPRAQNHQHQTFQAYLHMTPAHLLTPDARRQLQAIDAWLHDHDVPVERGNAKS